MDGMADFDAPAPPMGSEPPMDDPMMGDDMGMEDQNAMGDQPTDTSGNGENDELMNVINDLSMEDKAAVLKYAKSMADGNEGGEGQESNMMGDEQGQMPESRSLFGKTINERIKKNDSKESGKRPEKKKPLTRRNPYAPFG